MYPKKLNLNYLHKTTILGKRWIKIYDPRKGKNIITSWLMRFGLFFFFVFVALYSVHQYYPEYTKVFASSLESKSSPPVINPQLLQKNLDNSHPKPVIHRLEVAQNNNVPHNVPHKVQKATPLEKTSNHSNVPKPVTTIQKTTPLEKTSNHPDVPKPVTMDDRIVALLQQCEVHFKANRLTTGKGGTAYDCYNQVLVLQPNNAQAKQGKVKIEARYQQWAENALKKGKLSGARQYIKRLNKINPNSQALAKLQRHLKTKEQQLQQRPQQTIQKSPPLKRRSVATIPRSSPSKQLPSAKAKRSSSSRRRAAVSKTHKRSRSSSSKQRAAVSKTHKRSRSSSSKQRAAVSKTHKQSPALRCIDILSQESLGIRSLTSEQRAFKRKNCH